MSEFAKATYEDLRDDEMARLTRYLKMTKDDLKKIPITWVTKRSVDSLGNIDFDNYDIIDVLAAKLIAHAHMLILPTKELFTNDLNDFRYVTTLERWENGQPVDPPIVSIHSYENRKVSINDGRHRAVLAYFLNCETIPIAVHKSHSGILSEILSN